MKLSPIFSESRTSHRPGREVSQFDIISVHFGKHAKKTNVVFITTIVSFKQFNAYTLAKDYLEISGI